MDSILELDSGISEIKLETKTPTEWYKQILEAITEELLTPVQVESLTYAPKQFLTVYTGSSDIADEICQTIVKGFFTSSLNTLEKTKDRRQVINDAVLEVLNDAVSAGEFKRAVDLSIIFKNTTKEK